MVQDGKRLLDDRSLDCLPELATAHLNAMNRLGDSLDLGVIEAILEGHGNPEGPILVGHDPDFSELVAVLCGAARVPMRKGSLARIEVGRPMQPGGGTLRWLVPPDLLKPKR